MPTQSRLGSTPSEGVVVPIPAGTAPKLRKPAYAVGAVDHALVTLDMLAHRPLVRLTELALELGIGRATAHRLLQMMVYRGFAVQNADRSYAAGPSLTAARRPEDLHDVEQLRSWLRPHLEQAAHRLAETVHLKVLVGIEALCIDSVEGSRPLHTDAARGSRYPAEYVSGGLALLAALPEAELRRRYAGRPADTMLGLLKVLATTRHRGFGLVVGEGKAGITSIASLVLDGDGRPLAAITSSAPSMRLSRVQTVHTAEVLHEVAGAARRQRWH